MWVSRPIVLNESSKKKHLKRVDRKESICGSLVGIATPVLFDVDCRFCLDLVLKKRILEITAIEEARSQNRSVNDLGKVQMNDLRIRK